MRNNIQCPNCDTEISLLQRQFLNRLNDNDILILIDPSDNSFNREMNKAYYRNINKLYPSK